MEIHAHNAKITNFYTITNVSSIAINPQTIVHFLFNIFFLIIVVFFINKIGAYENGTSFFFN